MRTIHTIAVCSACFAFAAIGAAAQSQSPPTLRIVTETPMTGKGGQNEIEILSWSWGQTRAAGGNVEFEWKVEEGESAPPAPGGAAKFGAVSGMHRDSSMKESGEKGGTEDINIGVGELQDAGKKPTTTQRMLAPGATKPTRASAMPAEKRQHGWVTVSKPLERGAVRVKVKFPWAGCRVGTRYPKLALGGGGQMYELSDAVVTSCGSTRGDADDRPTEEVAFNYSKVQVRGWNPEKKEE